MSQIPLLDLALIAPSSIAPSFSAADRDTDYIRNLMIALKPNLKNLQRLTPVILTELTPSAMLIVDAAMLPELIDAALPFGSSVLLVHTPPVFGTGGGTNDCAALLPRFARLICTGAAAAERLIAEHGLAPDKVHVVPPGIDRLPRSSFSLDRSCQILSIGALIPRQGHDHLLRALARLFDLDWRLTIVGAPRHAGHAAGLRDLVIELGIGGRVDFVGDLSAVDMEPLWAEADVFALASHWDGYPLPVAQALRRGLPVAVTAHAEIDALVPDGAGLICSPNDWEGLSRGLRRLIFDRGLRRDMADAAWRAGAILPDWQQQATRFLAALPRVSDAATVNDAATAP